MNVMRILLFSILAFSWLGCRNNPLGGGLLLPQPDSVKTIPWAASAGLTTLVPPAVDMEPDLPPAGTQGQQGSCVAWALGYNLASYYERSASHLTDYGVTNGVADPNRVYSPAFVYNYLKRSVIPNECVTGIQYTSAFRVIQSLGICTWKELPYNQDIEGCKIGVPDSVFLNSRAHSGYIFERINNTVDDIKLYTSLGLPVIVGLFTSANLYAQGLKIPQGHLLLWSPDKNDRKEYHAMLVVGYDNQNFKLMNSWGNDWGTNGYVLIPYRKLLERTLEVYICQKKVPDNVVMNSTNNVNLKASAARGFTSRLANRTSLSLGRASMTLMLPDTSKDQVLFRLYDSSSSDTAYKTFLGRNAQKQFYISNKLITLTSKNAHKKKKSIDVSLSIDSGRVDNNVRAIDSSMERIYQYLQNKKAPTDEDKALLEEFDLWHSGYQKHRAGKGFDYTRYWLVIPAFMLGLFTALFMRRRYIKRKKTNRLHQD